MISKWVSVKERQPAENGIYIVFTKCRNRIISWFINDKFIEDSVVTHWLEVLEDPI